MNRKSWEKIFKDPGADYRSKPFWSWNGKMEEKELFRQLDILKEMGFGGAFMHSRVGLATEYLGDEWMRIVEKCLEYGKKIDFDLWIYDEDRWPSGSAGGIVTQKKENRSHRLQLHILKASEGDAFLKENQEKMIAAYQCILEGHEYRELTVYEGGEPEEGKNILAITLEESELNDNYNGATYLDTMKASAVDDYLASTHDKYHKELSKDALERVRGVFTDEPHRGAFLCDFSEGNQKSIPYTDELFSAFKERYGYDLKEHLPEIFLREQGKTFSGVTLDYLELVQDFFLKNFLKKIQDRCQEYGWLFTGHLLHEDTLSNQTCMLGSLMTGYEYMDIPGIDLLGERTSCWWIAKQLSSVAHQMNKKKMLTELFGCTGWQMKFENYKSIGDWQALMGINLFCPHLSWYTMKGENKRDYPASIFYQSAWYKQYRYMEDYFARFHVATDGTPSDCKLLVMNPIESVWARTYTGCFQWIQSNDEGISAIERQYEETFRMLMGAGIDFDYGEERILAGHGSVENGKLKVGSCTYDKVLLSGVETMKESTWKLLKEFVAQGGKLIVAGKAPEMIHAEPDARMTELMEHAEKVPFTKEAVTESCALEVPLYQLENHGQQVYIQSYRKEDMITFILLNMDRDHSANDISLTLNGEGRVEEWNARTGEIREVMVSDGKAELCLSLLPGEEKIFVLQNGENLLKQKEFSYKLSEKNVAALDRADVYLDDECVAKDGDVLKEDRLIRDRLGYPWRGGEMMQPWYIEKYYQEELKQRRNVKNVFHFVIEELPEGLELAVEAEEHTEVRLNGTLLKKEADFWIDTAFSKFLAGKSCLKEGENEITVTYSYGKDSGLEAIYLLGDFGVKLSGKGVEEKVHLISLPDKLHAGNIVPQGLPFYSGSITYELDQPVEGKVSVTLDEMTAAVCMLHGDTDEIIAFAPYEAAVTGLKSIEMVFNRRNTFGPLHVPVSYRGSYGPDTFLKIGDLWEDEVQLYSQGLPEKVTLRKID